jgi:ligand-binding sensor domain-containing protein/signal transduction histidine kinase
MRINAGWARPGNGKNYGILPSLKLQSADEEWLKSSLTDGLNTTGRPEVREFRRWICALIVVVVMLGGSGNALALDPARSLFQYNCRNWTRQNGLPMDKINTVTQSKDGYLWLGTDHGLARFDGNEFQSVAIDLPAAHGQEVRDLIATADGKIWFVIHNAGFGSYDGQKFSAVGDSRWSEPGMGATAILAAKDGAIWTGGDVAVGRWATTQPATSFYNVTNTGQVRSFCEDSAGRIWIGTSEHGLFYWADGKIVPVPDGVLGTEYIVALVADAANKIWAGTSRGLRCYSHGQVTQAAGVDTEVTALLVDRRGTLWIGTRGQGLGRYEHGKLSFLKKIDGLSSDNVMALCEDAEGSLWVGTMDGLSQLSDVKFPIFSSRDGMSSGSIHSVVSSKNGGLWVGGDVGLAYFDGTNATKYATEPLLPNPYIKLCFEARNGDVYAEDGNKNIGMFSQGKLLALQTNSTWATAFGEDAQSVVVANGTGDSLYRIQNGKLSHYRYTDKSEPNYYWVNNFYTGRDGALWVACKNGIFRLQAGTVKHWNIADGLSGDNVLWICEDPSGAIWAGLATGMARLKDGKIKNIAVENGLPDNWIYAIVPDDLGALWCDSGRGIFRVSLKSLNDFADGNTARVDCQLFKDLEAVKFIGRTDQEYSGCKTPDGRIWFPSPWGVVMIDPAHLPVNRIAPPIQIGTVLADGKAYSHLSNIVVPPGHGELKIDFTALSFIAPEKIRFRYQLEDFDHEWVEAEGRHEAFYTNLKPGRYTFHVTAANAEGLWNPVGDSVQIEIRPHFRQTTWFYLLCGCLALLVLAALYAWRIRRLQKARTQLEAEVTSRTTELQHEVEEHRQTTVQLAARTKLLEGEIAERERMRNEIEGVHQRLLETSRLAGMAEVAINVLHNVGNVLNSVNISAALVVDQVRQSRVAKLGQVVALLNEHTADLGAFLTTDPQGRLVPSYLSQLAEHLTKEQAGAIAELELLRHNIEHIKEVVAMQQSYAMVSGVTETVNITELVEDALRMTGVSARELELVRDYAEVPLIEVQKHKVLQILVNLIRNAMFACSASDQPAKQVIIKISPAEGAVQIAVMDNGVGIAPENLTRIFNHGFTTRKGGHGFGLHSGALAAKELGGSLAVQSDGPGAGATFTLRLPVPVAELVDSKE